jgi:magnesium chelatase family protein
MQEVSSDDRSDITSASMYSNVIKAFMAQKNRNQLKLNGKLSEEDIEKFCILNNEAKAVLDSAISRFGLTHRSIASIKKVARTIADLEGHEQIAKSDLLEALSYRRRK